MQIEITQFPHEMARTPTPPAAGPASGGIARKRVGAKKVLVPPGSAKKAAVPTWLCNAEEEIKKYCETDKLLMSMVPLGRLVKEVAEGAEPSGVGLHRWQALAVRNIQKDAEYFLSELFADAELAARHAKRVTVTPKDFAVAIRMRRLDVNSKLLQGLID